jgi:hypothetical protein
MFVSRTLLETPSNLEMDSDHADNDTAKAQLLAANILALSDFNFLSSYDSWQQTDVKKA